MKYILVLSFLLISQIGFSKSNGNDTLRGTVSVKKLKKSFDWFKTEYDSYEPAVSDYYILRIKKAFEDKKVYIVMGTWCSDSKREVPRFFKVLKYCGLKTKNVKMVAVDKSKESGITEFDQFETVFVPTFIFIDKTGKEMGRIIESPSKTIEYDLMKIIKPGFWEAQ